MGWFGYEVYDGDETQTRHLSFLKLAKIKFADDDEENEILSSSGTILNSEQLKLLKKNIDCVLRKMPRHIKNEDDAIKWQMLLSLFIDNKTKPLNVIFDKGIEATQWLIDYACEDFEQPGKRRAVLKRFIRKATNLYYPPNKEWLPSKKEIWLLFDMSNGDSASKRYVWWFDSKETAMKHRKHQLQMKYAAKLSKPIRFMKA